MSIKKSLKNKDILILEYQKSVPYPPITQVYPQVVYLIV